MSLFSVLTSLALMLHSLYSHCFRTTGKSVSTLLVSEYTVLLIRSLWILADFNRSHLISCQSAWDIILFLFKMHVFRVSGTVELPSYGFLISIQCSSCSYLHNTWYFLPMIVIMKCFELLHLAKHHVGLRVVLY